MGPERAELVVVEEVAEHRAAAAKSGRHRGEACQAIAVEPLDPHVPRDRVFERARAQDQEPDPVPGRIDPLQPRQHQTLGAAPGQAGEDDHEVQGWDADDGDGQRDGPGQQRLRALSGPGGGRRVYRVSSSSQT